MIGRIIGGIALIALGIFFVIKSEAVFNFFGRVEWAERNLGYEGGSRLFFKLLGVAIALFGMMIATNMVGGIVVGTVGRLFTPGNQPISQ